jgi:hypothetical protein
MKWILVKFPKLIEHHGLVVASPITGMRDLQLAGLNSVRIGFKSDSGVVGFSYPRDLR